MAKILVLVPDGWECKYSECRPGLFVSSGQYVNVKTEYGNEGYCGETGERFCSTDSIVQPVKPVWEEE